MHRIFYNYKFRERDDIVACVTLSLGHVVTLAYRKSKMAAIFQDGHEQVHFISQSRTYLTYFIHFFAKINVLKTLMYPLNVP